MRCLSAPVNAPFSCPKSSRFEEVLLQCRAVHLDEVARRSKRVVVHGARDELFTGAGLAANEDRGVALGDLADDREHFLEGAARTDDAIEVVDVAGGVAEVVDLVLHPAHLERLLDLDLHLLDFERLLHVVERARLHGLDRRRDRSERGHQDDGRRGMQRLRRLEHIETGAATHLQVADDDIEEPLVELLDGGVTVRGLLDIVASFGHRLGKAPAERVVVVSDQYPSHVSPLVLVAARYRQRHSNGRALTYGGPQVNSSVVCVDNLPNDGQSQPRPLRLRREERVEDFLRHIRRNSRAIVSDLHENGLARF